ncbi:MAG TPA: cytochrome b/b6 domain-containing protein [Syntrophorhabdales bacterium]|nr:cytochrome b/b6 domain-containing protein [Syntrophorhabdales bacterium]
MKKTYLHPLPLRVWHWVNAAAVTLLLATGIQLRLAGIPDLPSHSTALLIHRYAGWTMVASCVFWLIYGLASNHLGRHYRLRRRDIEGIFSQTKFYVWSIFKGEENPHRPSPDEKFNPLQKLAYGAVMCIFTPVLVVTGLLFSDILLVRKYILAWNIVKLLDAIHVIGAYLFVLYLVVHVYMATLGRTPLSHIKAMIVGYEEEHDALPYLECSREQEGEKGNG